MDKIKDEEDESLVYYSLHKYILTLKYESYL